MSGSDLSNGTKPHKMQIHQLAFNLPHSPDTTIHLHLTNLPLTLMLFFASTAAGAPSTGASLGSLVYSLPNRNTSSQAASQPLSTPLYSRNSSIDFATRLARIMARRTGKPVYVGGEVKFWETEEEAEAMRGVVEVVMKVLGEEHATNGTGST